MFPYHTITFAHYVVNIAYGITVHSFCSNEMLDAFYNRRIKNFFLFGSRGNSISCCDEKVVYPTIPYITVFVIYSHPFFVILTERLINLYCKRGMFSCVPAFAPDVNVAKWVCVLPIVLFCRCRLTFFPAGIYNSPEVAYFITVERRL